MKAIAVVSAEARSLLQVFRTPAILGLISLTGLSSGLIGDGIADWISWLCLGCIIGVCVYFSRHQNSHGTEHDESRSSPHCGQHNTNNS